MSESHEVQDAGVAYNDYFVVFRKISELLTSNTELLSEDFEQTLVETALKDTLSRLAYTGNILHMKYAFEPFSLTRESLSIASNGFPSFEEINSTMLDLAALSQKRKEIAGVEVHKFAWLKHAIANEADDPDSLWLISERRYLEMLDYDKMMIPVVTGELIHVGTNKKREHEYMFWWTCYSAGDHFPAIHILEFTQSTHPDIEPLHLAKSSSHTQFMQTILRHGSRTPDVTVLAGDIDTALPYVHPKRLLRVSFDRLYTHLLVEKMRETEIDSSKQQAKYFFSEFAEDKDFLLEIYCDVVVSAQSKSTGLNPFGRSPKREVFRLDRGHDLRGFERGATRSTKMILVPHRFAQIRHSDRGQKLDVFLNDIDRALTYTAEGDLHAI